MTLHSPSEPIRSSTGTRLMSRVLLSTVGQRLSRSFVILRVRGRTTGTLFELVVQYAHARPGIVIMPARPESKQWWRNLREPRPIEVLRDGTWHHARGIVLHESDAEYADARAAYVERWPRVTMPRGQLLVLITWLDERDQAAAKAS